MTRRLVFNHILALLLLGLWGCQGTASFGSGGTLLGTEPDSSTSDDDDDDDNDDNNNDDDDDDDDADIDSFEGVFGFAGLGGTQRHPTGRYTVGYSYFVQQMFESGNGSLPEQNGPRGEDEGEEEFGCNSTTPEDAGNSEGRGIEEEYVLLDAGDELVFVFPNDEEDLTWRLPWTDVGDGTGLYFAPPPQSGGDETNPRALPPDERLDFIVPGGEDIPPFEIRSGLRTHPGFEVDRPSLPAGGTTFPVNPELGIEFVWPSLGEARLYIEVVFTDQEAGSQWRIECTVPDEGSWTVEPDTFSDVPAGTRGRMSIRRFVDEYHEATSDHPDLLLQGSFQHQWAIQLEGGESGNGSGAGN